MKHTVVCHFTPRQSDNLFQLQWLLLGQYKQSGLGFIPGYVRPSLEGNFEVFKNGCQCTLMFKLPIQGITLTSLYSCVSSSILGQLRITTHKHTLSR